MVVSRAEMTRLAKRLARLPVDERRKIEGIGLRRAEIVVAGAMVYHELLDRCHLKGFRYSPLGLRDGLLAQMAAEHDRSTRSGRQIESERWESITRAVAHYRVDMKHALDVRESAMFLFSALRSVHGLAPEFREWLSAAAMLYEVGDYVNRNGHHRHTYYIISNSEILGYTPQQRRLIAAIARYLGKSRPTLDEPPMKAARSRRSRRSAKSDHASPPGARPEPGPQPRRAESARQPSRRRSTPDAGATPPHGGGFGIVGDREGRRLFPRSVRTRTFHRRGVESAQRLRRQTPLQRARTAAHVDPRHRSFLQFDRSFTSRLADHGAEKLAQIGIVSHHHDRFLARIFFQQPAKIGESRARTQSGIDLQLAFVAHLVSHQRSRLRASVSADWK